MKVTTSGLVPPGVVTVTVRVPGSASDAIASVAVPELGLVIVTFVTVTPVPLTVTVVSPSAKSVPVRLTWNVWPRIPDTGVMLPRPGVANILNGRELLSPPGVLTATVREPSAVLVSNVAVIDVEPLRATFWTTTPAIGSISVAPATNPVPVNVIGIESLSPIEEGNIEVSVGGLATLKVRGLLVPATVVTVTLRPSAMASAATVKVVVSDVVPATVTVPPVTPVPPMVTAVAPGAKLVPVSVTGTSVPCSP